MIWYGDKSQPKDNLNKEGASWSELRVSLPFMFFYNRQRANCGQRLLWTGLDIGIGIGKLLD